jgi:hypothetical protein
MTEPKVITKNYKPEQTDSVSHCPNPTAMLPATTIIRIWRALPCLARRAEQDYPDARYPTTTIKPAPNAEANEAGGANAAKVKTGGTAPRPSRQGKRSY